MFAMRDKRDEIVDLCSIREATSRQATPGKCYVPRFPRVSVLSVSKGNLGDPTSDQAQVLNSQRGPLERIINSATNK